ncbi:phage tail assembly protein [Salinisphaera orenii]|uniref:phage tail assembly protein n=1 Tax=Salinisphaera orenii TaxID=856731 RepID=UPI000DBE24A1
MDYPDDQTVHIERTEDIDSDTLAQVLPVRIQLDLVVPKPLKGGETSQLTFEEATGAHIEQMSRAGSDKAQTEVAFRIMAECCGLGPDEIKQLGGRDIRRLSQVLEYFLPSGSAPAA